MLRQGKARGNSRLVVIFQKMGTGRDEIRRRFEQMTLHPAIITMDEAVVEDFVVSVIKPQGLQAALETPVNLSQKEKFGPRFPHRCDGIDPKFGGVRVDPGPQMR